MNSSNDVERLISNIIWETAEGKVSWSFEEPPRYLSEGTEFQVHSYLTCHYKGRQRIGVYERRYRQYTDFDESYWSSMCVFLMLDDYGRIIYESEEADSRINNLFSVARDNASKVNDIIRGLLK